MTERLSAKELDEIERDWTTPLRADGTPFEDADPGLDAAERIVPKLVAEVRRLRSLVGRAAFAGVFYRPAPGSFPTIAFPDGLPEVECPTDEGLCWWCCADLEPVEGEPLPHKADCPWSEIEAEALAQRADEKC